MRADTSILIFASIRISLYKVFGLPILTLLLCIFKCMWFSSKILPIVSIHACISSMWCITIWTPNCFKMKHVEIYIFFKFIKLVNCYFSLRMSECTHIPIVTRFYFVWIRWTEFDLIFLGMVEFFYSIMRSAATISHRAFEMGSTIYYIRTDLTRIAP